MTIALLAALSLTAATFANPVVEHHAHGSWVSQDFLASNAQVYQEQSVWVDFTVQNWSYDKDCGIVWTTDGWTDRIGWAEAWYEGGLSDGRERWGVDLEHIVDFWYASYFDDNTPGQLQSYELEYAIYYTVDGVTYWDNNDGENYSLMLTVENLSFSNE